jgi:predicted DNA-binding transcriptional regulator AlpA
LFIQQGASPVKNSNRSRKPLLTSRELETRYSIVSRTISRWEHDKQLGFPKPLIIRGRRYWSEAALENWELKQAVAKTGEVVCVMKTKEPHHPRRGRAPNASVAADIPELATEPRISKQATAIPRKLEGRS